MALWVTLLWSLLHAGTSLSALRLIHSFTIHSLFHPNKSLLSTYYMPAIIFGSRVKTMSKIDKNPFTLVVEARQRAREREVQHTVCPMGVRAVERTEGGRGEEVSRVRFGTLNGVARDSLAQK